MNRAVDFLTALARALSTMNLYEEGHPSRERALDEVFEQLMDLQDEDPTARFTFLGSEVVYGDTPIRRLKGWDWAPRLAKAGVQRLEFQGRVERSDLEVFLDGVHRRMVGEDSTATTRQTRPTNIRYGIVAMEDTSEEGAGREGPITATVSYSLGEEAETMRWLQEEMRKRGHLRVLEAEALVRSLSVAMHGDQAFVIPLLRLKQYDQYTTTHSLNVATLSMALAEFIGLDADEVRSFGISGLLHDMGKVRIPDEILNKPGKLTDEERQVMQGHTVEGARIILESEEFLDLAAVVAYEHHMNIDGTGYPQMRFSRSCHLASKLVHVCDVFDALRTNRPYRDAWPLGRVLDYLEENAGSEFDAEYAGAFVRMMREWSDNVAEVEAEDEPLAPAAEAAAEPPGESPGERSGARDEGVEAGAPSSEAGSAGGEE